MATDIETPGAVPANEIAVLLAQGQEALDTGNSVDALKLFRQVTERAPDNAAGWVGMAKTVRPYREKREHLRRALAMTPDDSAVQQQLAAVEARLAAGDLLAPKLQARQPEPQPAGAAPAPVGPKVVVKDVCYRHPDRETGLYCTQCERPICTECVRPAFVGQLCPECAQERRPRNYKVSTSNLVVAGAVSFGFALLTSFFVVSLLGGFFFFGLFLAIIAAPFFAELLIRVLDRLTQSKRGNEMRLTVGLGLALGAAPLVLMTLGSFISLLLLLFFGIAIGTTTTRLR